MAKGALTKSKAKTKELKIQLSSSQAEKENTPSNASTKHSTSRKTLRGSAANSSRTEDIANDQALEALKKMSKQAAHIVELEALVDKLRTVDALSQTQISDLRGANQDLA